jgi:uncharacterized protein YhbP (UPF0306 family)
MPEVKDLLQQYLKQTNIMQLATTNGDQPWACNVHFYADEECNFYWNSLLTREHSQHIARNPKVAAAILVHENTPDEPWVIGISVAGTAEMLGPVVPELIGQAYVTKLAKPPILLADVASGRNPGQFYRLTPTRLVLFDTKNSTGNPRQEIKLV